MPTFSTTELAQWTGGRWAGPEPWRALSGFCQDTRRILPGDVFVALRTERRDGHQFLTAALDKGAGAALVESEQPDIALPQLVVTDALTAFQAIAREYRCQFGGKVVGITGSYGKTSTKEMLALLLGERCLKTEGNFNNAIGVPLTLTRLEGSQHTLAVIEAGINQPGEMAVLADMIRPDISITTGIGPAHLEMLGSEDGIAQEKVKLSLASDGSLPIFPSSCLRFAAYRALQDRAIVLYPEASATDSDTTYWYQIFHTPGDFTELVLRVPGIAQELAFRLPPVSRGMAVNAGLCILTALQCGVAESAIHERLNQWQPVGDRGRIEHHAGNVYFIDCYNANPTSMLDAVEFFQSSAPDALPRLYVLGGMKELGDASDRYHRRVGEQLRLRDADRVLLVGEESVMYLHGLIDAGNRRSALMLATDAAHARELVAAFSGAIFLKGSRCYALENLINLEPKALTC